jgi:beta-N-acetylhexosaminidase
MRAISNGWSLTEAIQQAVLAGVDIVVIGNNLDPREDVLQVALRAVNDLLDSGRIDHNRVQLSIDRINSLKAALTGQRPWNFNGKPTA